MASAAPGLYGVTPDARYARGVSAGSLAELFGIGRSGLRWPQVLVVMLGTWFSGNAHVLGNLAGGRAPVVTDVLFLFLSPVAFVFAAIIGIRSFQSGPAVAVASGVIYALLHTAIRYAIDGAELYSYGGAAGLIRTAVVAFAWPAMTVLALQFAVSGAHRWIRMAVALALVSVVQLFLNGLVFLGSPDVSYVLEIVASPRGVSIVVSAIVWTLTFRVGLAKFGGR